MGSKAKKMLATFYTAYTYFNTHSFDFERRFPTEPKVLARACVAWANGAGSATVAPRPRKGRGFKRAFMAAAMALVVAVVLRRRRRAAAVATALL
eukprot:SAG31_NODE_5486_length_2512_cov_1.878989_2_plen_95_part_00